MDAVAGNRRSLRRGGVGGIAGVEVLVALPLCWGRHLPVGVRGFGG